MDWLERKARSPLPREPLRSVEARTTQENVDASKHGLARFGRITQNRSAFFQPDGSAVSHINIRWCWRIANARGPPARGGCRSRNGLSYPLSGASLSI